MTVKKWRPFWSYDVEKTERWLAEMAAEGKRLAGVNRMTRMFSFQEGSREKATYQIIHDKLQSGLPRTLESYGWKSALSDGNWQFVKNEEAAIRAYPGRDNLLKRNRLHSLVLTCISVYYAIQLIMPLLLVFLVLSGSGEVVIEPSPLWSLTILYFLQVIAVIVLTIVMTRKLKTFERKYYDVRIDEKVPVGKTYSKWKPGWMTAPDLLVEWLEDMALAGNHLVKVRGTRFTFEKGAPKRMAYHFDIQWRPSPGYTDIHKSAGWRLKYTSPHLFMKYAIWAKEYEAGEQKPHLTYDLAERKAQIRKVVLAHGTIPLLTFGLFVFLYMNIVRIHQAVGWSLYERFLVVMLIVAAVLQVYLLIRTIRFAWRRRVG